MNEYKMFRCMESSMIEFFGKKPVYISERKEKMLIISNSNMTIQSKIDLSKTSCWRFNHPFGITFYFEEREMLLCFKALRSGIEFFGVRGHGSDKLNEYVSHRGTFLESDK